MATNMYGPVNSQAIRISEFYGSVNGETRITNKIYGPGPVEEKSLGTWQGNETTSFTTYLNFNIYIARTIRTNDSFRVIGKVGITYPNQASTSYAEIYKDLTAEINGSDFHIYTARTKVYGDGGDGTTSALTTDFDVTIPLASGTSTYAFDVVIKDTSHRKTLSCTLDSSEAGATLIHQGFGHHDYGYGILTYFTDANHTQTNMVELSSYNLRRLSGYYSSNRQTWNVTINGVTISNKDIYGVILTNKVTSLPPYFLSGCEALNSPLKLPPTLTSISDSGETNGSAFLFACKNMLAPIDVGSLSPSIVKSITSHSFSASDANAPAYTIGMTIVGANRAEWLSAFPNRGALIYRKLIDGGY